LARLHLNSCNVSFDNFAQGEFVMIGVSTALRRGKRCARHLRSNGETDAGAPGVDRGKAAWNRVDCYAGRAKTLFQAIYCRLIIDFH
jgi:hypothetical protein